MQRESLHRDTCFLRGWLRCAVLLPQVGAEVRVWGRQKGSPKTRPCACLPKRARRRVGTLVCSAPRTRPRAPRQVRKSYEEGRRRRRARGHRRAWKLQRMAVDAAEEPAAAPGRGRAGARAEAPRGEADLERFMEARCLGASPRGSGGHLDLGPGLGARTEPIRMSRGAAR